MGDHTGLATGWDPGTPTGGLAPAGVLAEHGRRRCWASPWATAPGPPTPTGRSTTACPPASATRSPCSSPSPYDGWEAVLDELEEFFAVRPSGGERTGPTGHVLLFSPWPTPDLRARGWTSTATRPSWSARRPPCRPGPSPPAPDLRIVEVADAAALADFERTLVEAFPLADAAAPAARPASSGPRCSTSPAGGSSSATATTEPVATAAAFVDYGVSDVNFVSTRREARGRGYGEVSRGRRRMADPALPAALLASDDGRPVYERMGYLPRSSGFTSGAATATGLSTPMQWCFSPATRYGSRRGLDDGTCSPLTGSAGELTVLATHPRVACGPGPWAPEQ